MRSGLVMLGCEFVVVVAAFVHFRAHVVLPSLR
jgi:hypothetical protein